MTYVMPINRSKTVSPLFVDLVVGIDPDLKGSGWAVWSRSQNRFTEIRTVTFAQFIDLVNNYAPGSAEFVIDAGWLNEKTNFHAVHLPENIRRASPATQAKYVAAVREKTARDVGINSGVGMTMSQYLKAHKHRVIEFQPTKDVHKWDKDMIARQTGYTGKSNPETRDAMRDAWLHR